MEWEASLERRFDFAMVVDVAKMNNLLEEDSEQDIKSIYHLWCPVPAGGHLTMELRETGGS